MIALIGCINYSNLTVPVKPFNYWCRTHTIHTFGTSPSRCGCTCWSNLPPPLGSDKNYTVDWGKNKLNDVQILFIPWLFQLNNIATQILCTNLNLQVQNKLILYSLIKHKRTETALVLHPIDKMITIFNIQPPIVENIDNGILQCWRRVGFQEFSLVSTQYPLILPMVSLLVPLGTLGRVFFFCSTFLVSFSTKHWFIYYSKYH